MRQASQMIVFGEKVVMFAKPRQTVIADLIDELKRTSPRDVIVHEPVTIRDVLAVTREAHHLLRSCEFLSMIEVKHKGYLYCHLPNATASAPNRENCISGHLYVTVLENHRVVGVGYGIPRFPSRSACISTSRVGSCSGTGSM